MGERPSRPKYPPELRATSAERAKWRSAFGKANRRPASVDVLVDGRWEPADDTIDTQLSEDTHDAAAIAEAWAEAIDADRIAYLRTLRRHQEMLRPWGDALHESVTSNFKPGDPEGIILLGLGATITRALEKMETVAREISSTGYQRMMAEANMSWSSIVQAFKDAGFPETSVWQTGGGCLAIGINLKRERHAMLTTKDGVLSADRSAHKGEAWMLGLYLGEEDAMSGEGFISEVFGTDAGDPSQDADLVEKIKPYLDLLRGHHEDAYFVWLAEESRHEISGPYETPGDALADKSNYPMGSELAICDTNGNFIPLQF